MIVFIIHHHLLLLCIKLTTVTHNLLHHFHWFKSLNLSRVTAPLPPHTLHIRKFCLKISNLNLQRKCITPHRKNRFIHKINRTRTHHSNANCTSSMIVDRPVHPSIDCIRFIHCLLAYLLHCCCCHNFFSSIY